ncbi:MAG: dockerin type I repeat-containing protein [Clostridia bacterium]|nr:dockerin type I repeat-containing protein [Clostridia bacterium]
MKKIIVSIVTVCFIISTLATICVSAAPSADVNRDRRSSANDILALSQHILGVNTINNYKYDVNDDGTVDSTDLAALQNHILGVSVIEEEIVEEDPFEPGIEDAEDEL